MKFIVWCITMFWISVMIPNFCYGSDHRSLPFPFFGFLKVGQSWTYSNVSVFWVDWIPPEGEEGIDPDTLHSETVTIIIEDSLHIEDSIYFKSNDGNFYRVTRDQQTWKYDAETTAEILIWDIWRPQEGSNREVILHQAVLNAEEDLLSISRQGPYVRDEWNLLYTELINANWIEENWIEERIIDERLEERLIDWGVDELYKINISLPEQHTYLLVALNVGVIYYESLAGYGDFTTTKYTLEKYKPGQFEEEITGVEQVTFGQVKSLQSTETSGQPVPKNGNR